MTPTASSSPTTPREIGALLSAAHCRRNAAGWSIAFLGLRQGEA